MEQTNNIIFTQGKYFTIDIKENNNCAEHYANDYIELFKFITEGDNTND